MNKNNVSLNLSTRQMVNILTRWADSYFEFNDISNVKLGFLSEKKIGYGITRRISQNELYEIKVGIGPYSKSILARNQSVKDLDFTIVGSVIFHELAHYEQSESPATQREILISDLSKCGNKTYYYKNWMRLPHEIDAEQSGILSMWSHLREIFDDNTNADTLMMARLSKKRAEKDYIFDIPDGGFQSIEQIDMLFDTAYDKSLVSKRIFSPEFRRSNDEIAQLLMDDHGVVRSEYQQLFSKMEYADTGQEIDMMMASLVSYIHPELQNLYPQLDFSELNPLIVFGASMPETRDEIFSRIKSQSNDVLLSIHVEDDTDFTRAVEQIRSDAGQEL